MPKILLPTPKLRRMADLVHPKTPTNLVPTSSSVTGEVNQLIQEIQELEIENQGISDEIIGNFQDVLSQADNQYRAANRELQILRDQVSKLSLELTGMRDKLRGPQENIISQDSTTNETEEYLSGTRPIDTFEITSMEESPFEYGSEESVDEEFEEIIPLRPTLVQGYSYGESNLEEISARASLSGYGGRSFTVEIANHLNHPLKNFELFDPTNCVYLNGPNSIAPNTMEVLTFSEPSANFQHAAFSYSIPKTNMRLALMFKLQDGDYFGMEFTEENTSMEEYYRNAKRLPLVTNLYSNDVSDGTLFVDSYETIQVRANVTLSDYHKGFLRIDIVDVDGL